MDVEGSNQPRVESKDDCWGGGIGLIVRWKERKGKKKQNNNNPSFLHHAKYFQHSLTSVSFGKSSVVSKRSQLLWTIALCMLQCKCTKVIDANRSHCFVWGLTQYSTWYQNEGPCSRWYRMLGCWIQGV